MVRATRRQMLKLASTGVGATAIAGCLGGGGDNGGGGSSDMHIIEPEGAATIPVYLYGTDQGVWEEYNINLSTESAAFGKFTRALTNNLSNIAGHSIMYGIQYMNEGEDQMTSIGQQLNFYNQIMSKQGSGIQSPEDLADTHLGVPSEESQTTRIVRAMILDEYDFDILEEPQQVNSSPPPTLWNLLQDDEVDAVLEFSGFTIAGNASDNIQTVFDSYNYWLDRTGQPPSVADFVVYTDWLEENAQLALDYLNGWWDATGTFRENSDQAIQQYGTLGGISNEAEQEVAKQWADDGVLFPLERGYPQKMADSTYELMQLLADYDLLKGVPDDSSKIFTTIEELKSMT